MLRVIHRTCRLRRYPYEMAMLFGARKKVIRTVDERTSTKRGPNVDCRINYAALHKKRAL
jgi:hypothetical protein